MRLLKRLLQRLLILGLGILQCLVDCLCGVRICGPQAALVSGVGRHLWNSSLYYPPARGPHGSEDPAAQVCAQLHDHGRRIARRSSQPCAGRDAATASCRLCIGRLVGGRSVGPGKFVAHDPRIRIQVAVSHRAVQHALPFRTRTGHRLPEGDRQQPAQAPPHPILGFEPRACRGHVGRGHLGNSALLAKHRSAAGRCKAFSGSAPAPRIPVSP